MQEQADSPDTSESNPTAWAALLRAKADLRQAMVARLKSLSAEERQSAAAEAAQSLTLFLESHARPGSTVALYAATATELSSEPAVRSLRDRYRLAFPRVEGPSLTFRLAELESLTAHQSRVREPLPGDPMVTPDVVVIPGRAFDRTGIRLGHGFGYYDHAMAELPGSTLLIGFCYRFQVVEQLPRAAHDRWVHWLVADGGAPYRCVRPPESDTMSAQEGA